LEGGEGGSVDDDKKVITFEHDDQKGNHFKGKNTATPSVTAPGDTNVSDATAFSLEYLAYSVSKLGL